MRSYDMAWGRFLSSGNVRCYDCRKIFYSRLVFFYLKFKNQKKKKSPFEARQCKIISLTPITKPHQQKMFLYTQELLQTGNEQSKSWPHLTHQPNKYTKPNSIHIHFPYPLESKLRLGHSQPPIPNKL